MTQETKTNKKSIDALINKISFDIVNERILDKTQIEKTLGVLVNDGVYAWWVYTKKELSLNVYKECKKFENERLIKLLSQLNKLNFLFDFGEILNKSKINEICDLQKEIEDLQKQKKENNVQSKVNKEINEKKSKQNRTLDEFFQKLSEDLNSLLFFRDILEKILIYARYHAKALGEKNE